MLAIVQDSYGPQNVYKLAEIEKPKAAPDEVLIRVCETSVHADVWHMMTGLPKILRLMGGGFKRPTNRVPGTDLSGVVDAIGANVTRFKVGDAVFGETLRGMQWCNGGAWAEYAVAPENSLASKPANVSFETAAAVPTAGLIALLNLRGQGRLQAGQDVLINGAGGGVGVLALQLSKALGANVTAVDRADKLPFLQSIGADAVIDYTREDFTRGDKRFDLIFDIPGNHSFRACKRALKPTGVWVLIAHDNYGKGMHRWLGAIPRMFALMFRAIFDKQLPRANFAMPDKKEEMAFLRDLMESGKLAPPIDKTFKLGQAEDAMAYLMSGQAKGKVMIKVSEGA